MRKIFMKSEVKYEGVEIVFLKHAGFKVRGARPST